MFVAIDGIDGSGKTSAAEGVAATLRESGRAVVVREHPSSGFWGRRCASMLVKTGRIYKALATVYLTADMLSVSATLRRARKEDADVIVVRYGLSCFFLGERRARIIYRLFSSFMPTPDIDIMIDTDPETAIQRILCRGKEAEMFENRAAMESTRAGMLSVPGVVVVDGNGSREDTIHHILDVIARRGGGLFNMGVD